MDRASVPASIRENVGVSASERQQDQRARQVGLIGSGIAQSLSPALHEAEGAAQGLEYAYRIVDLDEEPGGPVALPAVVDRLQAAGFAGSNVTHPVKQAIIPLLDRLSDEARAMGAVNTIRFTEDGLREGHNTDWWGFGENLTRALGGAPLGQVVLLGAGGAGAAAAYALGRLGATHIAIADADAARAADLAARMTALGFSATHCLLDDLEGALAAANGLVHATPTGMAKYPGMPIPAGWLRPDLWVAEIVYVPLATELLQAARALGCRTADGGGMVVLQAARAFEIFTGHLADTDRMLAHFARLVG